MSIFSRLVVLSCGEDHSNALVYFSEVKGISAKHLQSLSLNLRLISTLVLMVKRHFKMPVEVGFPTD